MYYLLIRSAGVQKLVIAAEKHELMSAMANSSYCQHGYGGLKHLPSQSKLPGASYQELTSDIVNAPCFCGSKVRAQSHCQFGVDLDCACAALLSTGRVDKSCSGPEGANMFCRQSLLPPWVGARARAIS